MSRREFQFREGGSEKFWAITMDGPRFTVQFGRLGTAGQTQTKEFDSDAEAQKAAAKLIAEKTKKGYAEVEAAGAAPAEPAAPPRKARKKDIEPPPAPAEPAAPARLEVVRRIDVAQPDWLRLPGQPWRCKPRPPAPPFDLKECLDRLREGLDTAKWNASFRGCRIAPVLTPSEARFWLEAMAEVKYYEKSADLVGRLAGKDYEKAWSLKQIVAKARSDASHPTPALAVPLANLMPLEQFFELMIGKQLVRNDNWSATYQVLAGFLEDVLPYVTEAEAEMMRGRLRAVLDSGDSDERISIPWKLAAYFGMHKELLAEVETWTDGQFADNIWYYGLEEPSLRVFNLGDPRLVEKHVRRTGLPLIGPEQAAAWLIHTQGNALDHVRDSILRTPRKEEAEKLTKTFCKVQMPEAAPFMLELKTASKAPGPARQWLDDNPGNAIAGLVPVAGGSGKLAGDAVEYLRDAKRRGFASFIEEQLREAPAAVADKVRREVLEHEEKVIEPLDARTTPAWLRDGVAAAPKAALPGWARPTSLPPLLVGGRRLTDEQVQGVLATLRLTPLGSPQPLLADLKQHADRAALDAFTWGLFELWLAEGAPSKEKWAFTAVGHLGGDAIALKLTPLLRAWPGESQHQRAVTGLECLRAIGSDTALMQLNGIAQRLKFKGLQNKAREMMEAIAQDRGLTRDQLEDRIVPDLDLDERGHRTFDFGSRQFHFVLGPDLRPLVRDADGKVREDLPKPSAKDDAEKANAAVADWKLLKKQLRDAIKVHAFRLEQTMVAGRRWTVPEFELLLVRHPLMVNLVRRLLWGGYDDRGKLDRTFRVTEEQEYADADDRACALEGLASVGVVHPLHLTEEQRSRWGEVFGDYEIITPFPQLGRPVYSLEAGEAKERELTRFAGRKVPGVTVAGYLEKTGWQRGPLQDHGDFSEHYKFFPAADVTAHTEYDDALWASNIADPVKVAVQGCTFWPGLKVPEWLSRRDLNKALKLGDVDPVVLSEVLADLTFLASKAE